MTKSADLTIVFAFRDRDLDRVDRCLSSLAAQSCPNFIVHFVDYGSRPDVSLDLKALITRYPFVSYFYTETRGLPFNKSNALNIGIRAAHTPYVMNSDVDIIFDPDFIWAALASADANAVLYCAPHLLPKEFADWSDITSYKGQYQIDRTMVGTCQFYPQWAILQIRGFDESMFGWYEDTDMRSRLRQIGLQEKWLDEDTAIFHQWHPRGLRTYSYTSTILMPYASSVADSPVRNLDGWGAFTRREERPILARLDLGHDFQSSIAEFLRRIRSSTPAGSPIWLITDRLDAETAFDPVTGLQMRLIKPGWIPYMLRTQHANEEALAKEILSALRALADESHGPPGVVAVDLASYRRISSKAFEALMDSVPRGGLVIFLSYGAIRRPAAMEKVDRLFSPVFWRIYNVMRSTPPSLAAVRAKADTSLSGTLKATAPHQKRVPVHLKMARFVWFGNRKLRSWARNRALGSVLFLGHNLRDSLIPLLLSNSDISDTYIGFPTEGNPAILLKA